MAFNNRMVLPVILSTLAFLAGCSSSTKAVPPPAGGYNNANFTGTYVFSVNGTDAANAPIAMTGTVSADGTGKITGGTIDINDASFTAPALGLAVSGGSYSVSPDGRGKANLTVTTPFGSSVVVDFVLTSNTHGLITEFDGNASGSGTLDIQSAVTQAQLAGSYAFTLSGIDPAGMLPFGSVGSFTLDSNGNITAGIEDFNDIGFAYGGLTLAGSLLPQATGAPWIATLTATNPITLVSPFGTLTFDVYAVDATHLKFVEADNFQDGFSLLGGDAYTQTGASIPTSSTTYVFTMGGVQSAGPTTVGGGFAIDGSGGVNSGNIDINLAGVATSAPLSFNGNYGDPGVGGRTDFEFAGFQVGQSFAAYPTANAGLLMLELDGGGTNFMAGSALTQTSTTLAASQGYGMNLSGVNPTSEEDDIAEFTTTSTGFSGLVDFNDQGATSFGQALTGTYAAGTPPAGRYDFLSNGFNGELYVVDSSTALFVELDASPNPQVGLGTIQLQAATTGSAKASRVALPHQTLLPFSAKQRDASHWRHAAHLLGK